MKEIVIKHACDRCGHSPDDHCFDDDTLREGYNHMSPDAVFRCLGPGLDGCDQQCPDFVGQAIEITEVTS